MTPKEIYKIWAPFGKKWVDWVRPVAFLAIDKISKAYAVEMKSLPVITYLDSFALKTDKKDFAIIVDMSGADSVREGISLAKLGFRPVPIYNGTMEQPGSRATVDNQSVAVALRSWASELEKLDIEENARPAFLLDSNRLNMYKMEEAIYDNSWDVYPQDLPSPSFFMKNGIRGMLVVGGKEISRDLKKVLFKHQKSGMRIYHTNGYEIPREVKIRGKKIDKI